MTAVLLLRDWVLTANGAAGAPLQERLRAALANSEARSSEPVRAKT